MSQSELDAVFDRHVEVAFGRSAEDKEWRSVGGTFENLVTTKFAEFRVGPKDGAAMTQGPLAGLQRKAKAVKHCDLVMLDHDTGETMDEVEEAIAEKGLFAILWHTHSHMKPASEIPESKLVMFLRKSPDWIGARTPSPNADTLIEQCQAYLKQEKKINEKIVASVTSVDRTLTAKGVVFTVQHDPMPRVRSLFVLAEPFDFAARGTQDEAISEWKDRYAGLSTSLGLPFDASCVDPSRLMFLPARPRDADDTAFEIRQVDGRMLTLDDMPRLTVLAGQKAENDRLADPMSAFTEAVSPNDAGVQTAWKTPGFRKWLAQNANDFEIEGFLETHGLENRGVTTTGTCFECPTAELHTNGNDPVDRGFWAQNASEREGGFACSCSHASCKTAAQAVTGKVDRAWFVDEFCAAKNLSVEDLLEFCPNYNAAEDDRIEGEAKTGDEIEEAIKALGKPVNTEQLERVLQLMAKTVDDIRVTIRIAEIARKTGLGKTNLTAEVKRLRRVAAEAATGGAGGGGGDGGDNDIRERHPVPRNPADASAIWSTWPFDDQLACARARFKHMNEKDPKIFVRAEGGIVRLNKVGKNLILSEMTDSCQWAHELQKRMRFMQPVENDPEGKNSAAFPHIVNEFMGAVDLGLPMIERIVRVPVFGPEGDLRTEEGYDAGAMTYLHPNMEFLEVPDEVTEEDVDEAVSWIYEAIRDFPFTDDFTGNDPLPVRLKNPDKSWAEVDEEGFPLPNITRGRGSRAHFVSMLLQPFVRSMITGPCPAYLIDKDMPGTGAGFLANIAGYVLNGKKMAAKTIPKDQDEFRKEIMSTLREGATSIFLDNINHKVDSGDLAAALTAGEWSGRILGRSENVELEIKATWIFAANGGQFSNELMRRIVPERMDAGVPNPARDRPPSWYKHQDLDGWLIENRASLVWSCHVLIKNWLQQGQPAGTAILQSFNSWSRVMGGILDAARIPGFLSNIEAYLEGRKDDNEGGGAAPYIAELLAVVQLDRPFDMMTAMIAGQNALTGELDESLGIEVSGFDDAAKKKSFGHFLRRLVGKVHKMDDGKLIRLAKTQRTKTGVQYVLKEVAD